MLKNYPGSKGGSGVWQRIISEMPPHRVYIEPFLGSGVVLRNKLPAPITIAGDASSQAIQDLKAQLPYAGVTAFCGDARALLESRSFQGDELVFCDPPYLMETRSCLRPLYEHEFSTRQEHLSLLRLLKGLPCAVMVSGYANALYARELADWRVMMIPTIKRSGASATECLWLNFPRPAKLHDYRFLGNNFRERERIKKKIRRWRARLARMDHLERACLLSAVNAENDVGGRPPEMAVQDPPARNGARIQPAYGMTLT